MHYSNLRTRILPFLQQKLQDLLLPFLTTCRVVFECIVAIETTFFSFISLVTRLQWKNLCQPQSISLRDLVDCVSVKWKETGRERVFVGLP